VTATNHALTGAIIGSIIPIPIVAIPLALLSHIILDSIPHFTDDKMCINSSKFKLLLFSDIGMCFLIASVIFIVQPQNWLLIIICAFVATSPDFLWFSDYLASNRKLNKPHHGPIRRLLSKIQWSQTVDGAFVELGWFVAASYILITLLTT